VKTLFQQEKFLNAQMDADKRRRNNNISALLTVRFFSNQEEIFKPPFSRSAASRLGKSGLNLSLVAACRAACICGSKFWLRLCRARDIQKGGHD